MFAKNPLFNLYPNPASDIVTLNIVNRNNDYLTLNIYNVTGTLVKSEMLKQNQRQINVRDLSNGIYMVSIKSKGLMETGKTNYSKIIFDFFDIVPGFWRRII